MKLAKKQHLAGPQPAGGFKMIIAWCCS